MTETKEPEMRNLSDFLIEKKFGEGFPQGDTFLEIDKTKVQQVDWTDNNGKVSPRYRLILADGREIFCAKGVLRDIQELHRKGAIRVRVTRTGTTLQDTRYTVMPTTLEQR